MKLINRLFVLFLSFSILIRGLTTSMPYNDDSVIVDQDGIREIEQNYNPDELRQKYPELPEYRTANGYAYATQKDCITYLLDVYNVNYKNEEGFFVPIDNTIVPIQESITGMKTEVDDFFYKNKENDLNYYFGSSEGNPLVRVEKGGIFADIRYNDDRLTDVQIGQELDKHIKNEEFLNFCQRNPSVIYHDNNQETDVFYTIASNGLKETIFLYAIPERNSITYEVQTNNCQIITNEKGQIIIEDRKGNILFQFGSFLLIDDRGKQSDFLKTEIQERSSSVYNIRVWLNQSFLKEAQYPVIIDPTVQGEDVVFDTYTSEENPDYHYYLWDYLRTGKDIPYGVRKTYIKFTLPSIASTNPIKTGKVYLLPYDSAGFIDLNACRITSSWSSDSVTWNNSPSYSNTYKATTSSTSGDWVTLSIDKIVRRWNVGLYGNNGVRISSNIEYNTNIWATFYSSDYSTQSYGPKLEITVYTGTGLYAPYSGGMPSRTFSVKNNLNSSHSSFFTTARSLWNNSGAGCVISTSSSSSNSIVEDSTIEYNGTYSPNNGTFIIKINFDSIYNEGVEWNNRYIGTIVHELGHALSLGDLPNAEWCIMGYKRDRNVIYKPMASDITGVINQY